MMMQCMGQSPKLRKIYAKNKQNASKIQAKYEQNTSKIQAKYRQNTSKILQGLMIGNDDAMHGPVTQAEECIS